MDEDIIKELEEIYKACDTERVFEIQNRLANLLKGLCKKSSKPSLNSRTIQSAIPICPKCKQPTKTLVDCHCNCDNPKAD